MTQVRARNLKNYAKTEDKQSVLTLDGYGKINVIVIDNIDHALESLNLIKTKQLAIGDILNANIVYALSAQLNLRVGIFKEADRVIVDYIQRHISDDVVEEDKALVMEELKASWQRLQQHSLAKRYVLCGAYQPEDSFYVNPSFVGFGSYEIFIKDYLYSLTRIIIQKREVLSPLFIQMVDLVARSLQGKNYFPNYFLQLEQVILSMRWRCEIENFEGMITQRLALENELAQIKGQWLDRVKGTVLHDLEDIEKDFPHHAGLVLAQILDTGTCVTDIAELALYVNPLREYLATPSMFAQSVKYEIKDEKAPFGLFKEAVQYAIVYVAQHYGLMLKDFIDVPCYFWAGKGLDYEERLLDDLKSNGRLATLKPFELQAIGNFTKHQALLALIEAEKQKRDNVSIVLGLAALTLVSPPSPLLFRARMINPVPLMPLMRPRQSEEVLPENIPEEENILQLTHQSGTCTLF